MMTFQELKHAVRLWLDGKNQTFSPALKTDAVRDDSDCLWAFLEAGAYLAELIVSEPDFAPYCRVSFQIMDIRNAADAAPVFCFYDRESDSLQDILDQLDSGLKLMIRGN